MHINRAYYLNKLKLKIHNGLIKVIMGIRRCGKSYLLFTIFKQDLLKAGVRESHIIEFAFNCIHTKGTKNALMPLLIAFERF